jgi:phosphatidylserine/phosphatidylglycerophosphate/cardiolipin synthase-like enzyme
VLEALVGRGGRVAVVLREVGHNDPFLGRLKAIQKVFPNRLGLVVSATAHEKALIGDDYVLGGSMNITMSGLNHSDEHVLLRVDAEAAAQRRLALSARWGRQLSWG